MGRAALWTVGWIGATLFVASWASYLMGPGVADATLGAAAADAPSWMRAAGQALALAGSTLVALALVAAAAARLAWRWDLGAAAGTVAAWFLTEAASFLGKLAFARPRPDGALLDSFAFPSGHAARAAALAVIAAWLLLREPASRPRAALLVVLAGLWALAQAAGRVLVGVHYASDVVGGLGLGLAVAGFALVPFTRARAEATARGRS